MAPGIAAQMVALLGFRALTAYQRLWPLVTAGAIHLVLLGALAAVIQPRFGVDGVAIAYSIAWIGALIVTLGALRPQIEADSNMPREALATAVSSIAAVMAALVVLQVCPPDLAARLILGSAAFAVTGWIVGYYLGVEFVRAATRESLRLRTSSA